MNNSDNSHNHNENENHSHKQIISNDEPLSSSSTSSSSLSIYSSPVNSPNRPQSQQQQHPRGDQMINSDYEELIRQTKQRMSMKFECLEKETGLTLSTQDCSVKKSNINTIKNNNENDVINDNNQLIEQSNECNRLKEELRLKNEIIDKMYQIRVQVDSELEDLTASLFEEANKMVYSANVLRDRAEKELHEANLKIDMLTAEVQALKLLVITSTPSKPNAHLHPQLNCSNSSSTLPTSGSHHHHHQKSNNNNNNTPSPKQKQSKHHQSMPKKSPSNYELISNSKSFEQTKLSTIDDDNNNDDIDEQFDDINEIDPVFYEEFQEWRKCPTLEPICSNFMKRIYDEEIYPVFNFKNKHLTSLVLRSIESNTLTVEMIGNNNNNEQKKLPFPKKCALLQMSRICRYRMQIDSNSNQNINNGHNQWYFISQLCRNRIITVCDLFCYLRYVQQGLVKSNLKDIYLQIMKRRRNIALSKLGFTPTNTNVISGQN
ncbi:guanine nucleotide exchange factor for Rab-3A-like [Dermatophagoides pteronyssinus]|uniref:Guanine nucleotide exchange factor for Rab-3A-like n=1 Tax=Dermatophagoides pteronyssinus TaxID=6956 RepID=A0A6P6XSA3_DERPT|nr:guanine nucleotide exchange factor for Rab-3A-like [Dermatophagoides pteronyssinus]